MFNHSIVSHVITIVYLLFQVLDKYNPPDHFLPESYTCFFLLKMPRYSCKEVGKLQFVLFMTRAIENVFYLHTWGTFFDE